MATGDVSNIGGREPPPPSWDGPDPSIQFPLYKRNVRLWQFESEVDVKKRGVRLLRSLTGTARAVADGMEFDEISGEKGGEN